MPDLDVVSMHVILLWLNMFGVFYHLFHFDIVSYSIYRFEILGGDDVNDQ